MLSTLVRNNILFLLVCMATDGFSQFIYTINSSSGLKTEVFVLPYGYKIPDSCKLLGKVKTRPLSGTSSFDYQMNWVSNKAVAKGANVIRIREFSLFNFDEGCRIDAEIYYLPNPQPLKEAIIANKNSPDSLYSELIIFCPNYNSSENPVYKLKIDSTEFDVYRNSINKFKLKNNTTYFIKGISCNLMEKIKIKSHQENYIRCCIVQIVVNSPPGTIIISKPKFLLKTDVIEDERVGELLFSLMARGY